MHYVGPMEKIMLMPCPLFKICQPTMTNDDGNKANVKSLALFLKATLGGRKVRKRQKSVTSLSPHYTAKQGTLTKETIKKYVKLTTQKMAGAKNGGAATAGKHKHEEHQQ